MKAQGARLGTLTAFIMISPILGPETIALTAAMLGSDMTIARIVIPISATLLLGLVLNHAEARNIAAFQLPATTRQPCEKACGCSAAPVDGRPSFWRALRDVLHPLWIYFVLGLLVVALFQAFVPQGNVDKFLRGGFAAYLVAAVATQADVTAAKLTTARLDLLNEVARQFWTLAAAQRRLALLEGELRDWQKLMGIRKGELEAGEIATADLLTAQNLAAQRRQERWKLLSEITASRAALSVMTGGRPDAPLEIKVPSTLKHGSAGTSSEREAIGQALARNPLLAQVRARLEGAGFRVLQEERRWAPDPKLGPYARNTPDETFAGITLSFSLPVLDQNRDGIAAAAASVASVQSDLRSAELFVAQDAFTAFRFLAQAHGAYDELSELVSGPSARQRQLAEESFKLGAISERDLLAARIDRTQRQQELETLKAQVGLAEARLARVLADGESGTNLSWTRIDYKN